MPCGSVNGNRPQRDAIEIAPLMSNSPLTSWLNVFGTQGASRVVGVSGLTFGPLLAFGFLAAGLPARGRRRDRLVHNYLKRIVANIAAECVDDAKRFYADVLGLRIVMDQGWILTFAGEGSAAPQISVATEGGSGTPVPALSIEVDNFEEIRQRVLAAGLPIEYGPTSEAWGVTRFYVRDPFGRLLNVLTHG